LTYGTVIRERDRQAAARKPPVSRAQLDLENNFRIVLRTTLAKLDLVSREEFDVQTKVLERTRARLALLEARLAELEQVASRGAGSA